MYALDPLGRPRSFAKVVFFGHGTGYGIRFSSTGDRIQIWSLQSSKQTAVCSMKDFIAGYGAGESEHEAALAKFAELTR